MTSIDRATATEVEAAAFRRLLEHLRQRTDVQNINLMNLAGFCRNCLSNWYQEAASERGIALSKDESREIVCGMPYKSGRAATRPTPRPRRGRPSPSPKPRGTSPDWPRCDASASGTQQESYGWLCTSP